MSRFKSKSFQHNFLPAWTTTRFGKTYLVTLSILGVILGVEAAGVAFLNGHPPKVPSTAEAQSTTPLPTATTTATPTPSTSPAPSPTQGPVVKGVATGRRGRGAGPGVAVHWPAQVLDLANWKLTLPVAAPNTAVAAEIRQPQLATYSNDVFFRKLPDNSGVDFIAYVNGVTTSGSSYPRSELREMALGGRANASWSTTAGTHHMRVTESVDHLPAVKPQVVFAQIHDASDDVIEAEIERLPNGTNRLYVNHNGTQYGADLVDNYVLGTHFTLDVVAQGGFVDVFYNGVQKVHQSIAASGLYFKAGCYTQSNLAHGDAPGAYGEVRIYGLQVSHS